MKKIDQTVYLAEGTHVMGDVTLKENVSVWHNTVVRADSEPIVVEKNTNIQELCCLHVDPGFPMHIGEGVTVGHCCTLHGCTIGENTVIGMGSIVLNGAKIGKNCIIGAGSLVAQGKEIPDGSVAFGNPVKLRREMTAEDIQTNMETMKEYVKEAKKLLTTNEG